MRYTVWPMVIDVTFDTARVSVEELSRWMQLRDLISNENGYQVPFALEQCFSDDPRYVPCNGEIPSIDLNNARLNLEKIRALIGNLDGNHFPAELSPIVLHLRQIQEFALWKETQRLAFFQTGNVRQLESNFQKVDPKTSCKAALEQIRRAADKQQAQKLARHDWENCLWEEDRRQIGPYPQKVWDAFLSAYGIRERVFQKEIQ